MKRLAAALSGASIALAVVAACSSDNDATTPPDYSQSCGILASRCHPYDDKTQVGHDCHEIGHAGDPIACGPKQAECEAACPPIEGGGLPFEIVDGAVVNRPDAAVDDAGDATVDAGPDICASYCQCLTDTCSTQSDYIYTSIEQCKATCPTFNADEKVCWPKFCAQAKTLSDKFHACDHAMGKLNLDECETLP